ncbi:MAG: YqgE/AlgH family protein [Pseudomonadota bacterium]
MSISEGTGENSGDGDAAEQTESLAGRFLIAMPNIGDPRFDRSVIYVFSHDDSGARGLIVNRVTRDIAFADLLRQLELEVIADVSATPVRLGGPVEVERGFVLHSPDYYREEATLKVDEAISMTATIDVLKAIAAGRGPERALFALGYAGWGAGQLEREIRQNGWLQTDGDADIVFDPTDDGKWSRALGLLGVDPSLLSSAAGSA